MPTLAAALLLLLQVSDAPAPRACHALTYHAGLERVVLFGGASACGTRVHEDSRLWSWDGERWSVLADGGPSAREDALLAHDARRGVLVLYGGRNGVSVYEDTWEWDRTAWREVKVDQRPGLVEHGAMAFDVAHGRTVLFGGGFRDGRAPSRVTWEWDGERWTRGAEQGPPGRVGLAMAQASDGGALLFGGFDPDGGPFRDLWRWEEGRWRALASAAPVTSEGHALAATRDGLVVLGLAPGAAPGGSFLVMRFAGDRWTAVPGAAPPWRVGGAVTYDARRSVVVLFGGHDPERQRTLADLWELGAEGWEQRR